MNVQASHLWWFASGLVLAFLIPAIFGNLKSLPVNWYYLLYFLVIGGFLFAYVWSTGIPVVTMVNKNLVLTLVLTLIFSVIMIKNVISFPATQQLHGLNLVWSLGWRGGMYGIIDGLLLSSFPFLVVWNAFNVDGKSWGEKIFFSLIAYLLVILITSVYHLGYVDFRSPKVLKANMGNVLISTPVILSGNPVAGPIVHGVMHVTAILHSPETDLFLPPHRL